MGDGCWVCASWGSGCSWSEGVVLVASIVRGHCVLGVMDLLVLGGTRRGGGGVAWGRDRCECAAFPCWPLCACSGHLGLGLGPCGLLVTRRSGEGTVGWLPVHVGGCVAGILLTVSWGRRALWGLVAWEAEWCGRGLRGGLL